MLWDLERSRMRAALDSQLMDPFDTPQKDPDPPVALRRIEMRVSVPALEELALTLDAWLKGIGQHLKTDPGSSTCRNSQVGLVFHFLKWGADQEHADQALRAAERLGHVLANYPSLRRLIVGIDAAGDERSSPPRVFLRAFHYLRKLERTFRPDPKEPPIRLGYTYHVGEDVDDLLTGLRHLDEVASLLLPPDSGGRLGHALALGDVPARFYDRRGVTEPRLGSHLLDLVWAWGHLMQTEDSGRFCTWIEHRLSSFCRHHAVDRSRCFEEMTRDQTEAELLDCLCKADAIDFTAPQPVPLSEPLWLDIVGVVQELLLDRIARMRVCVEANPTSNLLIRDDVDYSDLPYERLVEAGLAVSLNTDDPGLFLTTLPGELTAMYDSFACRRWQHREILAWLRERMFDAEQSTFLGQHVPAGRNAAKLCSKAFAVPGRGRWTE